MRLSHRLVAPELGLTWLYGYLLRTAKSPLSLNSSIVSASLPGYSNKHVVGSISTLLSLGYEYILVVLLAIIFAWIAVDLPSSS
ncbi:hypothetical protein AYI69_g235 [Smittium culicis]|uniref:Uncharacterized protein n=1 Tax=Smittium culicis TaxID=133412 RepID=A0A1R1YTK7_9FUNG|nr:hypothetical protein AYI69_g235 [Smittium culicis]